MRFTNTKIEYYLLLSLLFYFIIGIRCIHGKSDYGDCCTQFNNSYSSKIQLLVEKDTTSFVSWLNIIIKNQGCCIDAYLTRGDIFFLQDKTSLAKMDYFKVLSFDSSNVYALYQLGMIYQANSDNDSAVRFLEKALSSKKANDGDFAIDYHTINKSLSTNSDKYDISYNEIIYELGVCYYYNRDMIRSKINLDFCINLNYKAGDALLYRGAIYFEEGKKSLACADFMKANELHNENAIDYIDKYCK